MKITDFSRVRRAYTYVRVASNFTYVSQMQRSLPFFCFLPYVFSSNTTQYISTHEIVLFQQLARITKALDPNNTGLINFTQFCKGITQISSLQGLTLKEVASDLTRRSRENSLVEDSDRRSLVRKNLILKK